ncbi:putative RNA methylase [Caldisphaera lagunensis DSM 15908]|uniref:Putative RNA methylase n=1 Tax=Caldisphaera lagunensis (strain DSM 15908 / JCM 11604 / ANMR 0165 / IC-154) TaxID=1056495 RepID=L0AAE5_CALLD|nr:RsmD family RNA methyltransferase [Caldisphaera lagunensis]AFZ70883.1 putative RNA methylase [Caldisphaera lagunensis DSM 15908]
MNKNEKYINAKVFLEKTLPSITNPIRDLEQYNTPSEIILDMLNHAYISNIIQDSTVLDLGSGTCRIALASLIFGASKAIGLEIDDRFFKYCLYGEETFGLRGRLLLIKTFINENLGLIRKNHIDLIIMNPPFGVWNRNADKRFLEYAFSLNPKRIYSVLKSGNLNFHESLSNKWGYRLRLLNTREFPIPASMTYHKSRIRRVKVDVLLFEK